MQILWVSKSFNYQEIILIIVNQQILGPVLNSTIIYLA